MSVAPHAGVVDFGTFTPPTLSLDGIQGEVPQPLIGQENYVLTGNGWSSLAALGALTYQGTWDASTNTPTLVSSVGVQGYYYVVSVAGNTDLNGTTTWDVGDWAIFNGSAWQKIEGGSAGTFQTLTVTGQAALSTVTGNTSIADTSSIGKFGVKLGTLFSSGSAWDSKVALFGNINTTSGAGSGAFGVAFDTTQGTSLMSIAPLLSWYNMRYLGNNHQFFGIGFEQFRVAPINSAVNYVQVQGSTTGNQPFLLVGGSDANIALGISSKGNGNLNLFTNGGGNLQFQVAHRASADVYLSVQGGVGGVSRPSFGAVLAGASASGFNIYNSGGQPIRFQTSGNGSDEQFIVSPTTSAVNYVQVTGSSTGNQAVISVQGSDTNVALAIAAKGSGTINLQQTTAIGRNSTNWLAINGSTASGNAVQANIFGADTNVSLALQPKGTGAIDLAAGSSGVNISNGGTVTAITRSVAGVNYTTAPSLAISAPTTAGGVQATATCSLVIYGVTVANGGTGYTVGNTLTLVGGTPLTTGATYTVATVSSGVVTSVNYLAYNGYSAVPTSPAATTGGSGTGCTLNLTGVGINSAFTITNAGSGYVEQPTVTFSGGGGSSAAAIVRVGTGTTLKSLGGTTSFNTYAGEGLRINNDGFGTLTDYVEIQGGSSVSGAYIGVNGSTATASLYVSGKGGGTVDFFTNGQGNARQARVAHTASAVNYVQVTGGTTGTSNLANRPRIQVQGSDASIGLTIDTKGSGTVDFTTNANNATSFRINLQDSPVNYLQVQGSSTTIVPRLSVAGNDTNISMALQPKGTGAIDLATGSSGVNISNGNTVTGITRSATGSGYSSAPTVTIAPPTTAGGVQATAQVASSGSTTATIVSGGTGYTLNDLVTVSAAGVGGTFTVTGVSAGVVTAITSTGNGGGYTSFPTNPVSVTGGTGTGLTLNLSNFYIVSYAVLTPGSGYIEQPTVTITGGGGSGAAAYVSIGLPPIIRSLNGAGISAQSMSFHSASGEVLRLATPTTVSTSTPPVANYFQMASGAALNGPRLTATGSDTDVFMGLVTKGTGAFQFLTNSGTEQLRVAHTASAVNYVHVTGAATGGSPTISAQGSDTDINITLTSKGAGAVRFQTAGTIRATVDSGGATNLGISASGGVALKVPATGSQVNFFQMVGSATTTTPVISTLGSDTNVALAIQPKGTGAIDLAAGSSGVNISNGGTVTALTRTNVGAGYTSVPTITISPPTTAGGTTATATVTSMGINLVTVVSGGTGYAVNDEILISGGTFTTQARYRITAVSAGVVTTLTPITTPNYQALPTNPASTTTAIGTGSGLTLTVNWAVTGQSFTAGSGYIEQPTVTFSASGGSGAAAYATVGSSVRLQSLGTTSEVAFAFRGASGINSPTAPDILRILDVAAANDTGIFIQNSGFGRAQIQAYGNANANLFLCANGAGRVTFTTSGTSLVEQMRVAHTASAVNYVQVTGATTSNIPTISGQGSDTNVSMAYTTKGFSSTHRFQLGSAEALRIEQFGSTAVVNRFSMFANVSGGAPMLVTRGTDTNVGFELSTQGTGGYRFYTNTASNGTGVIQFAITHTASAVNYVQTTGGIAGQGVTIIPAGSDANILLALNSKGTNPIQCYTGGLRQFQVSDTASAVNFIQVTGSATATQPVISAQGSDTSVGLRLQWKGQANMFFVSGAGAYTQFRILGANNAVNNIAVTGTIAGSAPFISAEGSDTNIDLALTPKGTGRVKYGTHTANADAPITGYIEIVDSGGTIRKLAVIT